MQSHLQKEVLSEASKSPSFASSQSSGTTQGSLTALDPHSRTPSPSSSTVSGTSSEMSPPRYTTPPPLPIPPQDDVRYTKTRWQEANLAYNEEVLNALRAMGQATQILMTRINAPTDELNSVRHTIKDWTPERRKRFLLRVKRMVNEEEEERFEKHFGYRA
uniref:Uncharacterized protein n=1 Tax=Anopheles minimus TaxID=112268 RepID=A0A182VSH1_9DIPT